VAKLKSGRPAMSRWHGEGRPNAAEVDCGGFHRPVMVGHWLNSGAISGSWWGYIHWNSLAITLSLTENILEANQTLSLYLQ